MRIPLIAGLVLLLGGCSITNPVPYQPDREVIDSIPPDMARGALREVLGKARALRSNTNRGLFGPAHSYKALTTVEVEEGGLVLGVDDVRREYAYSALDPKAATYSVAGFDHIYVRLSPGTLDGWTNLTLEENDVIAFDRSNQEDVAKLMDALASLKAATDP